MTRQSLPTDCQSLCQGNSACKKFTLKVVGAAKPVAAALGVAVPLVSEPDTYECRLFDEKAELVWEWTGPGLSVSGPDVRLAGAWASATAWHIGYWFCLLGLRYFRDVMCT